MVLRNFVSWKSRTRITFMFALTCWSISSLSLDVFLFVYLCHESCLTSLFDCVRKLWADYCLASLPSRELIYWVFMLPEWGGGWLGVGGRWWGDEDTPTRPLGADCRPLVAAPLELDRSVHGQTRQGPIGNIIRCVASLPQFRRQMCFYFFSFRQGNSLLLQKASCYSQFVKSCECWPTLKLTTDEQLYNEKVFAENVVFRLKFRWLNAHHRHLLLNWHDLYRHREEVYIPARPPTPHTQALTSQTKTVVCRASPSQLSRPPPPRLYDRKKLPREVVEWEEVSFLIVTLERYRLSRF